VVYPYAAYVSERIPIEINGMRLDPIPGQQYKYDYWKIPEQVKQGKGDELSWYREVILNDLWFIVYFVLQIPLANCKYWIESCAEVEDGPQDLMLDLWAREHGKAVDLNEPVPTPDGWRKHGDLKIGDRVFGLNGSILDITATSQVFLDHDCYRVTFSDGYSVVVNADHLWTVGKKSRRRIKGEKNKRHYRDYSTLSTRELAKHTHAIDDRYSVDVPSPVKYPEKDLPINPYVLGCWLGDGTSSSGGYTCDDEEIITRIRSLGYDVKKHPRPYAHTIYGIMPLLRQLGVLNNKHIPLDYLQGSVEQRFELLRGLMDTDGTCDKRGTATFSGKSERLVRDVFELAASLGLCPNWREKNGKFNGQPYKSYEVSFQAYEATPVFFLTRKLERSKTGTRKHRSKFIVAVDQVPTIPTSCIKVDSEDGLYLIGKQFTTTHNTSIITTAHTIQRILKNPEERIAIFSYSKTMAVGILRPIKYLFENSALLKACFPDVLWDDPSKQAPKWSEEIGITVRRRSSARECTLEAHGLIEGMPTGRHYTGRIYDDVETSDLTYTPEIMSRLKETFDLSQALGSVEGWHWVIGTPYHHEGLLMYLKGKTMNGKPLYNIREKPATLDGTPNGEPVYFTPEHWALLQSSFTRQQLFSQYLLNPTPRGTEKLCFDRINLIEPRDIPQRLFRFMTIDPAGVRKDRVGDSWAMYVIGVEPYRDDLGASNIYILDMVCEPMSESEALDAVVAMYLRSGRILKLGIEKVGMMTAEIHIANALRARGKILTIENGGLELLRPAGRAKEERIEKNLMWPLNNGKIHISTAVPAAYRERLRMEMGKFPFWHDDALDALAYIYDLVRNYRFGARPEAEGEKKKRDVWDEAFRKANEPKKHSWMVM
jgi:hypothetical protein